MPTLFESSGKKVQSRLSQTIPKNMFVLFYIDFTFGNFRHRLVRHYWYIDTQTNWSKQIGWKMFEHDAQELLWFWNSWSCRSDGKSETSRRNGIRKQRQKQKKWQQWNRWQEVTLQYTKNCKKGLSRDCQGSTFHAARAEEMAKADEPSKTQRIREWDKRNTRETIAEGSS